MLSRRPLPVLAVAVTVALAACSGDEPAASPEPVEVEPVEAEVAEPIEVEDLEPEQAPEPPPPPPPAPMPDAAALQGVQVGIEPVADTEMLTGMAWREGDPATYLTTQPGLVLRVADGQVDPEPVLDLSAEVTPYEVGSERGLLAIAFDPVDGRMFLTYTDLPASDTHVVSYEVADGRAVPESRRQVLFQEEPGLGHNGADLVFTEDGTLFIAMGDGGGSRGRDAQDLGNLHGSILRVVPNREGDGYGVPPDNPFVGQPDVRPEIWAYGLRHPWRFSLDGPTGDLWIGDVGESDIEVVNRIPTGEKGLNFGWPHFEGTRPRVGDAPPDLVPPAYEYPHSLGPAVIGGHVYRGEAVPGLQGAYVFADLGGVVFALGTDDAVQLPVQVPGAVTSFAEGPDGELYVLTLREGAFRLTPA